MKRNWMAGFFLILVSLLVHGVAIQNPYYFDDEIVIRDNPDLDAPNPPLHFYKQFSINRDQGFTGYRPTLMMSYWANVQLLGKKAPAIRVGNILLHTANALLWAFIILQLMGSRSWKIAWWSSFAFALHPIQTLGVNFLWKRSTLLEIFFIFLGIWLHARERNRQKTYRWKIIGVQMFLFACALTTKESGIIFPLLLLLIDACFYRPLLREVRNVPKIYVPLFFLAVGYYYFRLYSNGFGSGILMHSHLDVRDLDPIHYLFQSLATIPNYIGLWLFPKPLLFDDPSHFGHHWVIWMIVGIGLFLFSMVAAFRFRRNPSTPFFIGIVWLGLLPTMSHIPIRFTMDQIRLYLPLAGLNALLITTLFSLNHLRIKKLISMVSALLLFFFTGFTILQHLRYRHPIAIFQDVIQEYPHSGIAWSNLAVQYHEAKMYPQALRAYQTAASLEPWNHDFSLRAAMWEVIMTKNPEQMEKSLMTLDVSQATASTLLLLIQNEIGIGAYRPAKIHLEVALQKFPAYAPVHLALAEFWGKTGDLENARKAYANALLLSPNNPEALSGQKRIGAPY